MGKASRLVHARWWVAAQNESVRNWFLRVPRGKRRAAQEDANAARYRGAEIAEFVATQMVAGLIAAPGRIEAIKKRAKVEE